MRVTSPSGQIETLQLLRAVAALMVVISHIITEAGNRGIVFPNVPALRWEAGVDLFFVISGFIMVYSSDRLYGADKARTTFWKKRIIRIAPLYWMCTAIMLLTLAERTVAMNKPFPSITAIAASFAFWPYDGYGNNDGFGFPVYTLGWTLNYEMFFYLIFGLFIAFARETAVALVASVLLALVVFGQIIEPLPLPLYFWSRPIVLEFVMGMCVAILWRRKVVVPGVVRFLIVCIAVTVFALDLPVTSNGLSRAAIWGVCAAAVLAALVLGPTKLNNCIAIPGVLLGDASYSLYLTHPFSITIFFKITHGSWPRGSVATWSLLLILISLTSVVAVVTYRLFERPVMDILTRRFLPFVRSVDLARSFP